ncbi:AMP-binding protein [Pseudotenacibaculum sp. MALMAid0570]|mgnify:CR=1 FL=1|uniref:AMP-binding protein n=1 Tax=Pseudotenacibaculum sp. MALMAid0570 TaxID=3143938 RepID=UPI0032E0393A
MNLVHKDFQLNGISFVSAKEIMEYSNTLSNVLCDFLKDWFSDEESITVKTSGSTGKPKAIELKKEYMINSAKATGEFFELSNKTTALCCLPIDFIAGKMMIVRAMVLGWNIDVIEPDSSPLQHNNKSYDFSAMVPLQLKNSLDKLAQIKKLIVGGGVVSLELQKQLQEVSTQVYATYGMTETITHIAVKKLNHLRTVISNECEKPHYQILPNISIKQDNRNCLVIEAPKVSDETIVTNDVIELISETEFLWKGRYDNVINSGGVKLHPEEIERKLSECIQSRFFVAGISDDSLGEKLILVVEGDFDTVISNEMRNLKTLSKYEKPKEIFFVKQFVETETKKIQRQKTLDLIF